MQLRKSNNDRNCRMVRFKHATFFRVEKIVANDDFSYLNW